MTTWIPKRMGLAVVVFVLVLAVVGGGGEFLKNSLLHHGGPSAAGSVAKEFSLNLFVKSSAEIVPNGVACRTTAVGSPRLPDAADATSVCQRSIYDLDQMSAGEVEAVRSSASGKTSFYLLIRMIDIKRSRPKPVSGDPNQKLTCQMIEGLPYPAGAGAGGRKAQCAITNWTSTRGLLLMLACPKLRHYTWYGLRLLKGKPKLGMLIASYP